MTTNDDLAGRLSDHYATEAPPRAPQWLLEEALATIDTTPQRRVVIHVPWRFPQMSAYAKLAVAAVAVIVVGLIGLAILRPASGGVGGPAVPPSPSPSPSPSAAPSPALTQIFTSDVYGISVSYPAGWTAEAATRPWTTGLPGTEDGVRDTIRAVVSGAPFIGLASQPLGGSSGSDWATGVEGSPDWGDTCDPIPGEPITVDGAPGSLMVACDRPMRAMAWTADRGYLIILYGLDDVTWFKHVLGSVRLHPEDAVSPSPSPSP